MEEIESCLHKSTELGSKKVIVAKLMENLTDIISYELMYI